MLGQLLDDVIAVNVRAVKDAEVFPFAAGVRPGLLNEA